MSILSNEIEAFAKEFKEKFTYGVLYSASSDLSAGKGTHFSGEDAVPAIKWLRQALLSSHTRVLEGLVKEVAGLKVLGMTASECKCCFARNLALSDIETLIRSKIKE